MTEPPRRSGTQSADIVEIIPIPRQVTTISNTPVQVAESSQAKRKRAVNGTPSGRTNKRLHGQSTDTVKEKSPLLKESSALSSKTGDTDIYSPGLKKELQVVFMSNRPEGEILPEEAEKLKAHLINKMSEAMTSPSGPELRFRNSGLTEQDWFLVTAENTESRDWLVQDCRPLTEENTSFRAILATEAPWPAEVSFVIECEAKPDTEKVVEMLHLQNRTLQVDKWKHLETVGISGNWYFTFRVNGETRKLLEAERLMWYELATIQVFNLIPYGKQPVSALSQRKKPGEKHQ